MGLDRRTLLKLGAAGVAVAAVGGGAWWRDRRAREGRRSDRIVGSWPELGPAAQWVLPDLHDARMVVPDRPHDIEEARDPARREAIRRTRTFFVNSSSRRLRGDRHGALPAEGARRLVAIGDSVTFGWGVADDESWPAQLERELGARGHRVEVLNAGVPAQRLETMRAWLEKVAPTLGVHGVLFTRRPYPEGPDPVGTYVGHVQAAARALPGVRFQVVLPPISRFDPHGMEVWRQERDGLAARLGGVPVFDLTETLWTAQGDRGCRLVVEGGQVRVVRADTGETLLTAPATARGLPESVYRLLEDDPSVREALFFDDGHPDAEGFGHVARALADRVIADGWLA